jgi:uncharacterized protein YbjT (DUF2867 family)
LTMKRILVTGGTGVLGNEIIPRLVAARYTVRVMSRSASQLEPDSRLEWAQADLAAEVGLSKAVRDVDIILNLATSPFEQTYDVDIEGTHTLLEYARRAGVKHVMHLSLAGCDRIQHPYFQHKWLSEEVVERCGVPYTILRTTHFHNSLDSMFKRLRQWWWSPMLTVPTDYQFQTIHAGEVADHLIQFVGVKAAGHLPDIGGPEVLRLGDMIRSWLAAQGMSRALLNVSLPTEFGGNFRQGHNTVPGNRVGRITWDHWLHWKYGEEISRSFQLYPSTTS